MNVPRLGPRGSAGRRIGGNHRRRRLPTLIAVVALSGLCGRAQAAPAQQPPNLPPAQEQAASGQTSAYFYYTKADDSGFTTFTDLRLVIVRAGAIIYDAAVPRYNKQFEVVPAGYGNRRSVFVSDLDRDSEPEVRLDLFWNGAHCCFWTDVYRYQPAANGYTMKTHFWGDPGYRLVDLNKDGKPEFRTSDDRFAYAFTDFADSGFPIQIWSYRQGRFANVTRLFPKQIRQNSTTQLGYYRSSLRQHRSVRGVLAAWAADQCLIHRGAAALRRLPALAAAAPQFSAESPRMTPRQFALKVKTFLRARGYAVG